MTTKEHSIICTDQDVQAILKGEKTQIRRPMKCQPPDGAHPFLILCSSSQEDVGKWIFTANSPMSRTVLGPIACPYGKPGDRLWVKETFCIESSKEVSYEPPHNDGRPIRHHQDVEWGPWWEQPHYKATDPAPELEVGSEEPGCRWRSPVCMPRWASRITPVITRIRAERLQDISAPDCWAEGIASSWDCEKYGSVVECYRDVWESIYGIGSWDRNPWVWVLEFQRVDA